jgi:hypothetical protein
MQDDSNRVIDAYQLDSSEHVTFDGRIDEPFWSNIEPATGFRMQEPNEGADASEKTEVRIAYDSENLYIGVTLFDSDPSGIKAFLKRRDVRISSDDRFVWILDTFNDQRGAYFMEINPNGLRTDGLLTVGQGGDINLNWDGIWDARTEIGDFGWSAEIVIPFRSLNFDPDSDTWGANFMRVIRRKNETVLWSGFRRNQGIDRPQDAGKITGLSNLSQGLGLEVIPYGIASRVNDEQVVPAETSVSPDAGVDVNYSITPGLKASITVNTDFAETEVDQRQVNLTRFPLRFPEQRDFFLEGSNIYEFAPRSGVDPFFSRNIGLNQGQPVPISYGARLLGNAGEYNVAFLHVRTGEDSEVNVNAENFTVARVRRNLGSESTIGVVYTRRATEDGPFSIEGLQDRHTFGTDLELGTSNFLGNKNLQFQAFFVGHNDAFSNRDETDIWDRSSRGIRLNFPNQPWSGAISYREFGEAYNPSVGFARRIGFRRVNPQAAYSPQLTNSDLIQEMQWSIWFEHLMDMDFNVLTQQVRMTILGINFASGDRFEIDLDREYEVLVEPFDIRRDGTIILPVGEYRNWSFDTSIRTASFRKISADLEFEYGGFWSGTQTEYGVEVTLRPFPGIDLNPEYIRTEVNLDQGSFSTDLFRFEGNYDFTTSLFLSSTIQYDNVSKLIGLNTRLRWIITPGSDLYFVYNHNWIDRENRFITLQNTATAKVRYTYRF